MGRDGTGRNFSSIAFGVCIGGVHGKGTKFMHLWCLFDCGVFLLEESFFFLTLIFLPLGDMGGLLVEM